MVLKCSLDSFTSSENSNYWRESLHEVIRQNIAGWCLQTFGIQKFVDNAQQCFAFTPQANFPAHYLNFHWRWCDWIQATFLNPSTLIDIFWWKTSKNMVFWIDVDVHLFFFRLFFPPCKNSQISLHESLIFKSLNNIIEVMPLEFL